MKEKRNREREQKQKIEKKKVERKAKVTQKLRFSRTNLVKEADRAFSIYVRNRDQ
jgi:translation elongation factor EF-Ts